MAYMNEVSPNRQDRHQGRNAYLTDDYLPKEVAQDVWQKARFSSLALRMSTPINVGLGETVIPVNTVQPEVGQVGTGSSMADREGHRKPVSGVDWDTESLSPIKIATVVTASEEFVRLDPYNIWSTMGDQLSQAVGRGIDLAVFHARSPATGDPLVGVDQNGYINATNQEVVFDGNNPVPLDEAIASAWTDVVQNDYDPNAIAIDPLLTPQLIMARDAQGNLIFQNGFNLTQDVGNIGGLQTESGKAVSGRLGRSADTGARAFVGDWSRCLFGYADPVRVKMTDTGVVTSANGTMVNLWQSNQVAILIETTIGWKVDPTAFSRLQSSNTVSGGLAPAGEKASDEVKTPFNTTS